MIDFFTSVGGERLDPNTVELVGGPLDGKQIELDQRVTSQFYLTFNGRKAWYQYVRGQLVGSAGKALYLSTTE